MSRNPRLRLTSLIFALVCLLSPLFAGADEVDKKFPFELDKWHDVNYEDGPFQIHRVRVALIESNIKSRMFRPGSKKDGMVQDVQIQVEYSNDSSRDIEAKLEIFWLDAKGRKIDGYSGKEDMDEDERRELMTALRSTLVYGLDVAKTLSVKILF